MVKQACSNKLLQSWMRTFEGNILTLLKSLDVEDSTQICSTVLEFLFKGSSLADIVQDFKLLGEKYGCPFFVALLYVKRFQKASSLRLLTLPDMPMLGSYNTAANKDMMAKTWTNRDTVVCLSRKHCGQRRNCSLRAISPFPTMFSNHSLMLMC